LDQPVYDRRSDLAGAKHYLLDREQIFIIIVYLEAHVPVIKFAGNVQRFAEKESRNL
jgi:hypothetical protein